MPGESENIHTQLFSDVKKVKPIIFLAVCNHGLGVRKYLIAEEAFYLDFLLIGRCILPSFIISRI